MPLNISIFSNSLLHKLLKIFVNIIYYEKKLKFGRTYFNKLKINNMYFIIIEYIKRFSKSGTRFLKPFKYKFNKTFDEK